MTVSFDSSAGTAVSYMAEQKWNQDIWLNMMSESFKGIDIEREYLSKNGSWTNRTTSVQRWSRVDFYA